MLRGIIEKLYFRQKDNLAIYDLKTGLLNGNWLIYKGYKELENKELYVFTVDINDLKEINDTRGHIEGDKIIKDLADKLKNIASDKKDYVVRYGGDEFIIFSKNNYSKNLEIIKEISFGVFFKEKNVLLEDAMKRSDKRMYINKNDYHKKGE